ncbi:PrsW family glutamic-type intramembrane protease [Candidatus Pelagibacter bacterium]|nr:PrsW family glutamic-type intramembrane protease [Candidatus Pelagibacter bacterium]
MIVLLATILPSIILVTYFVNSDKFKEPTFQIIKIFFLGILITIPAFFLNTYFGNFLETNTNISEDLIGSFLTAAPIEEGLKFSVLFYFVYKMKDFNEPVDGIVYGVCVSLGFATLENIYYVYVLPEYFATTPLSLALLRAFSAVPAHAAFGAIMGYFFMKYSFVSKKDNLLFSLAIPIFLHGFYNLSMSYNFFVGFILVITLWIIIFNKFSKLIKMQKNKRYEFENKI